MFVLMAVAGTGGLATASNKLYLYEVESTSLGAQMPLESGSRMREPFAPGLDLPPRFALWRCVR